MNIEEIREYCLSKAYVEESFPFDEVTLVFKTGNKMFALLPLDNIDNPSVNLKCEPERNLELREKYEGIKPGFHMNKKHWNTVLLDSDVDNKTIKELIDISYTLIFDKLPKKLKEELRSKYTFD